MHLSLRLITQSLFALTVIVVAQIILDRYRRVPWADVQKNQGSPVAVPSGLANALVVSADNAVHHAINAVALAW